MAETIFEGDAVSIPETSSPLFSHKPDLEPEFAFFMDSVDLQDFPYSPDRDMLRAGSMLSSPRNTTGSFNDGRFHSPPNEWTAIAAAGLPRRNGGLSGHAAFWTLDPADWGRLEKEIFNEVEVLPTGFTLPSRHTMKRYLEAYVRGFHPHLPFLHVPTLRARQPPPELILAIAAIGAHYCFDTENAAQLYRASKALITVATARRKQESRVKAFSPLRRSRIGAMFSGRATGNHQESVMADRQGDRADCFQKAQTLLLLMVMATWGNPETIYKQALGWQSTLANFLREEDLLAATEDPDPGEQEWAEWIRAEGERRTLAAIFCFFNLHTLLYDTLPPLHNSDLAIRLPCAEAMWDAPTETSWRELSQQARPEPRFQSALSELFRERREDNVTGYTALGGYVLILAIMQELYLIRKMAKLNSSAENASILGENGSLRRALENWRWGWKAGRESKAEGGGAGRPIPLDSLTYLRVAYMRINVDTGPFRALESQDPSRIAQAMFRSPPMQRSLALTQAALHSAQALAVPIHRGINVAAHSQASPHDSICLFEGAFVLSKWVQALPKQHPGADVGEDEVFLLSYLHALLSEVDSAEGTPRDCGVAQDVQSYDSTVLRIAARLLRRDAVWDLVNTLGDALDLYANLCSSTGGVAGERSPVLGQ